MPRIAIRTSSRRIVLLDAADIYYIEAARDDSLVRTSSKTRLRSIHPLADWERRLKSAGFRRIHRSYLVNLDRVREIRLRGEDTNDWELKLDPPVNVVLPIGRGYVASLWKELRL